MRMNARLALLSRTQAGYVDLTGHDNGFWAHSAATTASKVATHFACGVTSLEISWDYWRSVLRPPCTVGRSACFEGEESKMQSARADHPLA